jgi:putative cardiolipin synthase
MLVCLGACMVAAACSACAPRPVNAERIESRAYATPLATELGRAVAAVAAAHAPQSGLFVLDSGKDALLSRLALVEAAQRSLDLQYYIWNSDATGRYLAARVYAAAERGVRVRILSMI